MQKVVWNGTIDFQCFILICFIKSINRAIQTPENESVWMKIRRLFVVQWPCVFLNLFIPHACGNFSPFLPFLGKENISPHLILFNSFVMFNVFLNRGQRYADLFKRCVRFLARNLLSLKGSRFTTITELTLLGNKKNWMIILFEGQIEICNV